MKIKRFLKKLLKNIFSLLIWEIPIVLLFLMIYPKSPDKAIEMPVSYTHLDVYKRQIQCSNREI